jgi:hypothetical protein
MDNAIFLDVLAKICTINIGILPGFGASLWFSKNQPNYFYKKK